MDKTRRAYIAPAHEHAQQFYAQLQSKHGDKAIDIHGFVDNMKKGDDVCSGKEVREEFDALYLVETVHVREIMDSIPSEVLRSKKVYYVLRWSGRYHVLSSRTLYETIYRTRLHAKQWYAKLRHRTEVIKKAFARWGTYICQYCPFFGEGSDERVKRYKDRHKGERCFILGTGPSLNQVDLAKIKDEFTIGVNGIYKIAEEIDLDYFIYVSNWYWKYHLEGLQSVACKQAFFPLELQQEFSDHKNKTWIAVSDPVYVKYGERFRVPFAFSVDPHRRLYAGGTVLFLALQMAFYMGFSEVVLLGVDHSYDQDKDESLRQEGGGNYSTKDGDKAHYEKEYNPSDLEYHVDLVAMERGYALAKQVYEKAGRVIYNASPGTKLKTFEKRDFASLF